MAHLHSSAHPFSLRRRVDYRLNWPQPSPPFHFSYADIYWSLSVNFPSSHPFSKVELQRKSSRLCECMWFINEPKYTFIFHSFFCLLQCWHHLLFDSLPFCPFCLFLLHPVFPHLYVFFLLTPAPLSVCPLSSTFPSPHRAALQPSQPLLQREV